MKFNKRICAAAMLAGMVMAPGAYAQSTITNGDYTVGIGTNGELYNNGTGVGFQRNSDGLDVIKPGTPRDSWGISTGANGAYADQNDYGTSGITGTVFTGSGVTTTAVSSTSLGFTVSQVYSFAAPNILQIATTVTNTTAGALGALFQRNVDLDVDRNYNGDSVSAFGTAPANLVDTTIDGFDNPNPFNSYGSSCSGATCSGMGDLGGGIKLDLGSIAAGGSTTFSYFYGVGTDATALTAQAAALGVKYGISDAFGGNSAFIGVGTIAAAAPEPGTWLMMIVGFGLAGVALRSAKARSEVKFTARINGIAAGVIA